MTKPFNFDLRAARYLQTVVRKGGFSAAAEVHNRTQQAISKAIARFESDIGQELLTRGLSRLEPTEAGRLVLEHLDVVEAELASLNLELGALREGQGQRLSVGLSMSAESSRAGQIILEHISAVAEDVALSVHSGTVVEMLPDLVQGLLDMVIALDISGENPVHSKIQRREIGYDRFGLVVAHQFLNTLNTAPTLADLALLPWVIGRHLESFQKQIWRTMKLQGLTPPQTVYSSSAHFVMDAVRRFGYVTILPESVLHSSSGAGELAFLEGIDCQWQVPLCLYINRNALKRSAVELLVAQLNERLALPFE